MVTVSQKWDKRVGQWNDHVTPAAAFGKVLDRILVLSQPQPSDVCVDLGAGTGFVTTALAPLVASVRAVDISPAMAEALAERAADAGLANVSTEVTDLKDFRLPRSHADLIVSSYALHHLADADKRALTVRAAQWLCPGGRLVIADVMFGRGGSRRDRAILRQKVAALAAKGIGGWWRIAKNLTWLRAAVLGANDGIVSVAGIVIGVAGATTARGPIFTAGLAGLVAGAVSMALGEYVSVSSQRDSEPGASLARAMAWRQRLSLCARSADVFSFPPGGAA